MLLEKVWWLFFISKVWGGWVGMLMTVFFIRPAAAW